MKLIDEASQWYKMFSQRAILTIVALQGTMATLPAEVLASEIPYMTLTWNQFGVRLTIAVAILGFIGRLIAQDITPSKETP